MTIESQNLIANHTQLVNSPWNEGEKVRILRGDGSGLIAEIQSLRLEKRNVELGSNDPQIYSLNMQITGYNQCIDELNQKIDKLVGKE